MLLRIPSAWRSVPLLLGVFAVSAGAGALVVTLTNHAAARRIVSHVRVTRTREEHGSREIEATSRPRGSASIDRGPIMSGDAAASFGALAAGLQGRVGLVVAPLGEGPTQMFGSLQDGHAWSTMKVPVLVTLLAEHEHSRQILSTTEREDAALALERSDNVAAEAIFAELEHIYGGLVPASGALERTLDDAGDRSTRVNTEPNGEGFTTWGQSLWSTTGEVLFYRALARGCLLEAEDTAYVLRLMRDVIPPQRWGAGEAGYSNSIPVAFKGGWGPENGAAYLVRQTAIIGSGNSGYVISMIALPAAGSFEEGVNMITALAHWAREHARLDVGEPATGCESPG